MSDNRDAVRAWLQMLSAANAMKKSIDARLRARFGVSLSRFDAMAALQRAGADGLRAGELSQALMVTEGNTTQLTASLARDGLIRRAASPGDARVAILHLTKKGELLFAEMAQEHRDWVAEVFADAPHPQMAAFRRFLSKLKIPERPEAKRDAA